MSLINKDGSKYLLNKPNPIMIQQELWKKEEKLVFYNKIGKTVVLADETAPAVNFNAPKEPVLNEPTIVQSLEEPEIELIADQDKVQVWCLPATYKIYKDNLYGEEQRKIKYGNKFLLEAIILDQEDLSLTLWTNTKAVTEGSILFPRTHDKRWWRVGRIKEEAGGGYTVFSMISDYQPKFSD